jgi:hypothetical protein
MDQGVPDGLREGPAMPTASLRPIGAQNGW